jgi:hypothetical protein
MRVNAERWGRGGTTTGHLHSRKRDGTLRKNVGEVKKIDLVRLYTVPGPPPYEENVIVT